MFTRGVFRAAGLAIALVLIAASFSLPVIQDESYYWAWSRQLSLVYVDHPPATAWILRGSALIFGSGVVGLRVAALAAMAITAAAIVAAAERLRPGSKNQALLILLAAPMFLIGYLPATPDPFQGAA